MSSSIVFYLMLFKLLRKTCFWERLVHQSCSQSKKTKTIRPKIHMWGLPDHPNNIQPNSKASSIFLQGWHLVNRLISISVAAEDRPGKAFPVTLDEDEVGFEVGINLCENRVQLLFWFGLWEFWGWCLAWISPKTAENMSWCWEVSKPAWTSHGLPGRRCRRPAVFYGCHRPCGKYLQKSSHHNISFRNRLLK